jgi:GGDEF domain-containing protein
MFKRRPRDDDGLADSGRSPPGEASGAPQDVLRDELGIYHIWFLEQRLKEELARSARSQTIFSLGVWHLRLLPGEKPDPELLRNAAALIRSSLRSYDVPARIDEQRFAALLCDAEYEGACTVTFRIKGELQIRVPSVARWRAGVATFPRDGVDADSLIQAALRRVDDDARAA